MHLFVTGGAGFIGSAFVRLILAEEPGWRVTNFDALTYAGNLDNLIGVDPRRHRFIHGDIADRAAVAAALDEGMDALVHFAAESHVDRSIESADAFLRTNVLGTQVLLDCARLKRTKRFVQISTDEVMGSLPDDASAFFREDSPYAPNNPYAASKAAAEHLVRAAHHTFGLDVVITRCGNNYGPFQFPEKLIPLTLARALADQPIPVYGDGRQVRDWIYVTDHCRAIRAVLLKGRTGEIYHIGSRNERCNLELVEAILDTLGKPRSLIEFVTDRPGHDRRYAIDPGKIERELDWRPRETWQSGLARTIRWYQENPQWRRG
ncbi:MAG: dTDP-glucose 4,6-dehydratase [Planctomycetes bacterium]|nr:dTDP-glucose 4,6-dehydratase [Planctomycetota bacterium]